MPDPFLPSPALYLVATPIGNLRDITLRALDVLKAADIILCEDTRHSGKLLKLFDIKAPLVPYHDHSSDQDRAKIIEHLKQGKIVALISDAGSPMIADPGYKLVREVIENDLNVTSIPGASAVVTALQLSGLPSDQFVFAGFFPRKETAQNEVLAQYKNVPASVLFYETGPRLMKALSVIQSILGDRDIAIARELTKLHEEVIRGRVSDILNTDITLKGEFVLVVGASEDTAYSEEEVKQLLSKALADEGTKQAAKNVAGITGWSVQDVYKLALELKT